MLVYVLSIHRLEVGGPTSHTLNRSLDNRFRPDDTRVVVETVRLSAYGGSMSFREKKMLAGVRDGFPIIYTR